MTMHQSFSIRKSKSPHKPDAELEVVILLTEGFSLLSLASLTDTFAAVERACSQYRVRTQLLSIDGEMVSTHWGGRVVPDGSLDEECGLRGALSTGDAFIVCSGNEFDERARITTMKAIRRCSQISIPVCVMGSVVRILADAGRLNKGTDHWTRIAANNEMMPHVEFSNRIFVEDGNLISCCGELGAMDFALDWIGTRTSNQTAGAIRNHLLVTSMRSANRAQTCTVADAYKNVPVRIQGIIEDMLGNLEEPLPVVDLAERAGMSVRQVERSFARHLSTSPVKFYRSQQLEQAWALIEDTNLSVTEIAFACGFSSHPNFARLFRQRFGITPTMLRTSQGAIINSQTPEHRGIPSVKDGMAANHIGGAAAWM